MTLILPNRKEVVEADNLAFGSSRRDEMCCRPQPSGEGKGAGTAICFQGGPFRFPSLHIKKDEAWVSILHASHSRTANQEPRDQLVQIERT